MHQNEKKGNILRICGHNAGGGGSNDDDSRNRMVVLNLSSGTNGRITTTTCLGFSLRGHGTREISTLVLEESVG
jgi:hypothetical protein